MWAALLLILAAVSVPWSPANAQTIPIQPALLPGAIVSPLTGVAVIHGEGFSPGGIVYLAIYDRWGLDEQQHVWTVATDGALGPDGSVDPARGYASVGTVSEVISIIPEDTYGPNGSQDPAQGYVAADSGITRAIFAEEVTYGPHGSQDPAQGYTGKAQLPVDTSDACGRVLMVQAYDARTQTWSDPVDVIASC
jgi:hypothetical protein